ncbi:discoidin domain-containing protein [Lysinibacillus sp. NPDC097279]|uniref:discoidin domain-containing protein n=1 Tax=Lysinibacillus sp. NPDC097279 TaxID=3364143 RepID=UPI0038023995
MTVTEISFKCTKASSYYAIGGIRIYDSYGNVYPIKFTTKTNTTLNTFYIQGTNLTGTVSTKNSWGTYYFVDSPFDTDKSIVTSYPSMNYWLSSSADTISISFDRPIAISKIDFIPYCADGTDRKQNSIEITVLDTKNKILFQEKYNTSTYLVNQIYTVLTPKLSYFSNILLKSNSLIHTIYSEHMKYETKMTGSNVPAPFVASASTIYSTSYPAWLAFNGVITDSNNCWISLLNNIANQWVQIDYGKKTRVNQLEITGMGVNANSSPKDFEIQGSNDGFNFNTIKKFSGETDWKLFEKRVYSFRASNYRFFRLYIYNNNGFANYIGVANLLYSANNIGILNKIPVVNQGNFVKYGVNKIEIPATLYNEDYVLQDTVSEDVVDGLWKKQLDKKPLSIGFN